MFLLLDLWPAWLLNISILLTERTKLCLTFFYDLLHLICAHYLCFILHYFNFLIIQWTHYILLLCSHLLWLFSGWLLFWSSSCGLLKLTKIEFIVISGVLVNPELIFFLDFVRHFFNSWLLRLFIMNLWMTPILLCLWLVGWLALHLASVAWHWFRLFQALSHKKWLIGNHFLLRHLGCFWSYDNLSTWFWLTDFWLDKNFVWLWLLAHVLTTSRDIQAFLQTLLLLKWVITVFIFNYRRLHILTLNWDKLLTLIWWYKTLSNSIWWIL